MDNHPTNKTLHKVDFSVPTSTNGSTNLEEHSSAWLQEQSQNELYCCGEAKRNQRQTRHMHEMVRYKLLREV